MSDLSKEAVNLLVEWAEYRSDHSVHARTVLALIAENVALRAVVSECEECQIAGCLCPNMNEALDSWKADDHG